MWAWRAPSISTGFLQARVVADHGGPGGGLQPGREAVVLERQDLELGRIDLGADLHRVAAVGEDGGAVPEHGPGAGRAGEAAQPGEAIVGGGQILVLVLVLVRDQQAVEALLGHPGPNERQVLRPEGRIGGFVEGLAHGG